MKEKNTRIDISSGNQEALSLSQVDAQQAYGNLLQILAAAPDAYLVLSPDLKIQLVSNAYLAATLSERKNLVGKYIFDAFPENPATPEVNAVKNLYGSLIKVLHTKKPDQMELQQYDVPRPVHLGGGFEEKHWSPLNTPVLNESAGVSFIIHKVTDVTELVRSQEEVKELKGEQRLLQAALDQLQNIQKKLFESEALLREAEQVGHVGSYYGDIATLTFRFSEGMFSLLGLEPKDDLISLEQIDASSHPDDAQVVRQILEQAARDKQPYEYLRRIYRRDGQMRYLHSTGRVKCDSDGKAVKFIGIVHDVTERKQAEKTIRQSEQHYRTLVDNAPDVITRWDKDLRLIFNNLLFESKTGSSVSSLYLNSTSETEEPESITPSWEEKVRQVFLTGETQDHYNSFALPQGRAYYHSRLVPEFTEDGTVQSVLVITRDISALKRLEQENLDLRLTQQKDLLLAIMETQETERRRIAEGLHNGIGQLLYGAKLSLDQFTRDEVAKDATKLRASVIKTEQMLEQAITQARNISHELTPAVLEHFGLEVAMKQICATLHTEDLKFQCLVFNLRSDLERHLQISIYRMAQELANNIVKHAQATEASLLLRVQKNSLVLLAEDNGKGFEVDHIQTNGIGIKSIQDRVKLLNGTMRIHAAPDHGTLIQISLPITT